MDYTKIRWDTIIIGAGISGLAAANELQKNHQNVLILEAQGRIGGRIQTFTDWGQAIDLGASWIHGPKENPLSKLAEEHEIKTMPYPGDSLVLYKDNGELIEETELKKHQNDFNNLSKEFIRKLYNDPKADQLNESLENAIHKNFGKREPKHPIHWFFLDWISACGTELKNISFSEYYSDSGFEGEDCILPNGYMQICDALSKDLNILLNHPVSAVERQYNEVVVQVGKEEFKAKNVLVTVPLGALQEKQLKFFPPFVRKRTQALESLKMGLLNKVILEFEHKFWPDDHTAFGILHDDISDFSFYLNLPTKNDEKPKLMAFSYGESALKMEKLSIEELKTKICNLLQGTFEKNFTEPTRIKRTKWFNNQYIKGSYSYVPVGSSSESFDILSEPIADQIFFAGEATSKEYRSTVHGAYLSGLREASKILQLLS